MRTDFLIKWSHNSFFSSETYISKNFGKLNTLCLMRSDKNLEIPKQRWNSWQFEKIIWNISTIWKPIVNFHATNLLLIRLVNQ